MDNIKKYIDDITTTTGSSSFCILPWIHVATRPNGDMRLCCSSNASGATIRDYNIGLIKNSNGAIANFGKDGVLESFNNDFMCNVRKDMLSGKVPNTCTKCFEEESNDVISKRLWEFYEWSKELDISRIIHDTDVDGRVPPVIRYFDLRLGHTCNLKCVMCTPHDSSSWIKDNSQLIRNIKNTEIIDQIKWNKFDNYWYEKEEFWRDILNQLPNIQQLYFAGGEPLMIKEHIQFLRIIVQEGYANKIKLRYNSNLLYVTDEIIDLWSHFKQVRYACSIDDLKDRNFYIRYPSKWDDIEKILDKLDQTPDNIQCSIACTVQALNIKHITEFVKWKISKKYRKINNYIVDGNVIGGGLINLHLLYIPSFLSARVLPKKDKDDIKKIFQDFKLWLWENYTQDDSFWIHNPQGWPRWESILKFVESQDHSILLPAFNEYITNIDKLRNIDSKLIFPEIAHLM